MDEQRGEIPSLSELLAPSRGLRFVRGPVMPDGWVVFKEKMVIDPPSDAYIAACRAEGLQVPEQKPQKLQGPIDADDYSASLQIFYVKCAARDGDWRRLRGTRPTPKMQDLFVIARAKYLAWRKRRDEEDEREATVPKFWFEIEPGRFVLATSEEKARAWVESMKPVVIEHHERERVQIEVDTSKTCPHCTMRRKVPGRSMCGTCIENGYER